MVPHDRNTLAVVAGRAGGGMSAPRLLDLFCKAGGAGMGYSRAGFDVVGVDHEPQPNYPFPFIQADALTVSLEGFDAIHASPPCQAYSITKSIHDREHPDLVEPIRARLLATGKPYIIENVVGAPLLNPLVLCGTMFGLRVFRHRLFESNVLFMVPPHEKHEGTTGAHRGYSTLRSGRNGYICVAGHNFERQAGAAAMGIDWMGSRRELAQAIPPAYTEFLGRQLLAALTPRQAA